MILFQLLYSCSTVSTAFSLCHANHLHVLPHCIYKTPLWPSSSPFFLGACCDFRLWTFVSQLQNHYTLNLHHSQKEDGPVGYFGDKSEATVEQ